MSRDQQHDPDKPRRLPTYEEAKAQGLPVPEVTHCPPGVAWGARGNWCMVPSYGLGNLEK